MDTKGLQHLSMRPIFIGFLGDLLSCDAQGVLLILVGASSQQSRDQAGVPLPHCNVQRVGGAQESSLLGVYMAEAMLFQKVASE